MNQTPPTYNKQQVFKNIKYTSIWAVIIFVIIILPAEFWIDPTGFWKLTGLNKLAPNYSESTKEIEWNEDVTNEEIVNEPSYDFQNFEKEYSFWPWEDREIKFKMYKGSELNFEWNSSELMYFDQHGEPTTREGKEFLPYKTEKTGKQDNDTWKIVAEFTWTHGWYWRNLSNNDAVIKVKLSWNFEEK